MDESTLFNRRVIMAPMAGVNTPSFCEMLRALGCEFIYTGLLTCHGIAHDNRKTRDMISPLPQGPDIAAQIFGAAPDVMAEAAAALESMGKFVSIDINMGCPAPKVVKTSGGAALMADPPLAGRIVAAVAARVRLPVTVKIRSGWDASKINYLEIARVCIDNGATAIALHPRTRTQGFAGTADWAQITHLKESVSVPVIGSGDIRTPQDAARMLRETGCDSVMVGRACCGDPWLIARAAHFIETGEELPPPTAMQRIDAALRHLELHVRFEGENRGVPEMRKSIPWYLRGMPGASAVRTLANRAGCEAEVRAILEDYRNRLCTNGNDETIINCP